MITKVLPSFSLCFCQRRELGFQYYIPPYTNITTIQTFFITIWISREVPTEKEVIQNMCVLIYIYLGRKYMLARLNRLSSVSQKIPLFCLPSKHGSQFLVLNGLGLPARMQTHSQTSIDSVKKKLQILIYSA